MHGREKEPGTRMKLRPIILTITIVLLLRFSIAATNITQDDAVIMVKLAKAISPRNWSADNPCDWDGIECSFSGNVVSIDLSDKNLTGEIPKEITQLPRLEKLALQNNSFSGPFPPLANHSFLEEVYLNNNKFTSIPSSFLRGLKSLSKLYLSENPILEQWLLPETLIDSPTLSILNLVEVNLMGNIPDIFDKLPSLQTLKLSFNNLTGPLPPSFAKSGIKVLMLENQIQGLSGTLDVLANMTELYQVWLESNEFTGTVPDLSAAKALFDLNLKNNYLTGPLPTSITELPKLKNVSLQNNGLQGPCPKFPREIEVDVKFNNFCSEQPGVPCHPQVNTLIEIAAGFGYPVAFINSWTENNPCDGWQGISCDLHNNVTVLNFGKQGFTGQISPAIAKLPSLTKLLLNDNNLNGIIPSILSTLKNLRVLDISNNNISGRAPKFDQEVAITTAGNPDWGKDLNLAPSKPPIDGSLNHNSSKGTKGAGERKRPLPEWAIAALAFVAAIFLAAFYFVIYMRCKKRRRQKEILAMHSRHGRDKSIKGSEFGTESSEIQVSDGFNVVIPIEVLRDVTNNFSERNELGRGGFGVVYRGVLHDGTQIAVKRMQASASSSNGFQAEIAVLSKVRHRHLVTLYGFCIHENERLLVYEYMPQGTLGQRLFKNRHMGVAPLTWKQRIQIALDIAKGIEYLHNLAQQSFIHRDLKPSNVLLGDDMRAKVSDFGLVKNAPDGKYSVETRLAGTFGYLAPEYASTGRVTTKIDVFSFGVILMEMITGRKALDESLPDEDCHLVAWFRKHIHNKESIRTCLDPSLGPDEETFESICKVVELSGHCTVREPLQRPDMGHTVNVLSPLVEQWKPSAEQDQDDSYEIDFDMTLPQALKRWQASEVPPSGYHDSYTSSAPYSFSSSFNSKDRQ